MPRDHARQNLTPRSAFSKRVRGNQVVRQRRTRTAQLRFLPPEVNLKLIERVLRWYIGGCKINDIVQCAAKLPIDDVTVGSTLAVIDVYAIVCYANSRGYTGIMELGDIPNSVPPQPQPWIVPQRRIVDAVEVPLATYRQIVAGWRSGLMPRTLIKAYAPKGDSGQRQAELGKLSGHINGIFVALNRRVRQQEIWEAQLREQSDLVAAANITAQLEKLRHEHSSDSDLFDFPELDDMVVQLEEDQASQAAYDRELRETSQPEQYKQYRLGMWQTPPVASMANVNNNAEGTNGDLTELLTAEAIAFEDRIVNADIEKAKPTAQPIPQLVVPTPEKLAAARVDIERAAAEGPKVQSDEEMKQNVKSLFRKKPNQ